MQKKNRNSVNALQDISRRRHLAINGPPTIGIEIVSETPRVASNRKIENAVRRPEAERLATVISKGNKNAVVALTNLKVALMAADAQIGIIQMKN
jgi:hypothetical protein